jgi:hypothetical protein
MSGLVNSIANVTRSAYDLAFQVSPIILQGGIAAGAIGGMIPIIQLTGQLASFVQGAASSGLSTNDFFARYLLIPGGTFISQAVGQYPFANQQVAGNAVIQQPLSLSLLMICPVQDDAGYLTKLPTLSAFQSSLKQHNLMGGSYNVATPGLIYTNGVMLGMTHVDSGESKQQQIQFQLDFIFPLITQQQAAAAMGNLMQTATNGGQITGTPSWSGAGAVGQGIAGLPASITNFLAAPAI